MTHGTVRADLRGVEARLEGIHQGITRRASEARERASEAEDARSTREPAVPGISRKAGDGAAAGTGPV